MPQISKVLRSWRDINGRSGITWWCPGCKHAHSIATDDGTRPVWQFDGNLEAPTVTPSFRVFIPAMPSHPNPERRAERTTCHCFIKQGQIEFLNDCEHELRGLHPMVDLSAITNYGWGYE